MSHETIQARLLSYLDGEIPEDRAAEIRRHLRRCEECRSLSALWQEEKKHTRRFSAPPYLWARIQSELHRPAPVGWLDRLTAAIRPMLQPAAAVAAFVCVVFAGIQIGESITAGQATGGARIRHEFRMDYFAAVPSGSIGEELVISGNGGSEVSP